MPRPSAGQLRRPIIIEQLAQTRDAQGGMVKSWTVVARMRAKVVNKSGAEKEATGQGGVTGIATTEFTIRYLPGINTSMRVSYDGEYFNIQHVNDYEEEHRFLILTCDSGLSDG